MSRSSYLLIFSFVPVSRVSPSFMADDKSKWRFDPVTGASLAGGGAGADAVASSTTSQRFDGVPTAIATASISSNSGGNSAATYVDLPTATVFSPGEGSAPVAVAMPHRGSALSAILPGSDRNLLPLHGAAGGAGDGVYTDEWGNPIFDPHEDVSCAQLGCLFSCIPLIGWLTMYVNASAPVGSRRRALGTLAGTIATLSFIHMALFPQQGGQQYGGGWGYAAPAAAPHAAASKAVHSAAAVVADGVKKLLLR
jgi:hypothetical protein